MIINEFGIGITQTASKETAEKNGRSAIASYKRGLQRHINNRKASQSTAASWLTAVRSSKNT